MDSYRVLLKGGEGEIVEKKSRFIATVENCGTEEEAVRFLEAVKKKYWDAKHHCYAFVIGSRGEFTRCSDDGEPGGTAGRPMLEVLLGSEIRNVAVVVTRYFGGVLLGTGGLARAYTRAVKAGLEACSIGRMRAGVRIRIATDYNGVGRILYLLGQRGIEPEESSYTDTVTLQVTVPAEEFGALCQEVTDATGGRAAVEKTGELYYTDRRGEELWES